MAVLSSCQLIVNSTRGAIIENFVIGELLKAQTSGSETPGLYFWRDNLGLEIDLIIDQGPTLIPVEIKAGRTVVPDFLKNIEKWTQLAGKTAQPGFLVYGGEQEQKRSDVHILPWQKLDKLLNRLGE